MDQDIIYSESFKKWFGDWENDPKNSSKVVDKNGKPLTVYHGSYNKFDIFKSKGLGIHFGTKQASEDRLSNTADIDGEGLDYNGLLNSRKRFAKENGVIYPCFLNIRNPFILEDFGNSNFISSDIHEYLINYGFPKEEIDNLLYKDSVYLKDYLISKKFDGIFYKNKIEDSGSISYIVFYPNQIKSAINNNGNFSKKSNNIYESRDLLDMSTKEVIDLVGKSIIYKKSFKDWFGDWENDPKNSSKMIGMNGKPKIFYHGTNKEFNTFSTDMIGSNTGELGWYGKGFYFTTDYLLAKCYGNKVLEVYLNIRNPFYIDSNNLKRYKDELGLTNLDLYKTDPARFLKDNKRSIKLSELLIKDGYDGIVYSEDGVKWSEVVVFSPNQIKTIDNKRFNRKSDNMYEKIKSKNKLRESKEDKIYSKKFKDWFGDWENDPKHSSKVVDKNGKPLAVYHGSLNLFDSFDFNKGHNVPAVWHTDKLSIAYHWSNTSDIHRNSKKVTEDFESLKSLVKELESKNTPFENVVEKISNFTEENFDTKIESRSNYTSFEDCKKYRLNPEEHEGIYYGYDIIYNDGTEIGGNVRKDIHKYYEELLKNVENMIKDSSRDSLSSSYGGFLYKNYLNIRKPLIVDAKDEPYYNIRYRGKYYNTESLAMYAKERGYDGVIVKNVYETDYENKKGTDYIVFNPNQIKSATDNNGNFSKESNSIYEKIKFRNRLNESKESIIYSKEFKDWFGDWETDQEDSSKMVDNNGKPKVFLHGTPNKEFSSFSYDFIGSTTDAGWCGKGFYFYGNNEAYAYQYGANGRVIKAYLNIRNPYFISTEEVEDLIEHNDKDYSKKFTEDLISEGYDGVYYNGDLNEEVVAFYPNQIKSAIDNNGNFSKESGNIYEKVLHKNNRWIVTDHTGKKNLGTYSTKEEAERRLKQVEYFKHKNESNKTMNNYRQFFDKYTERTVNINNVAYQANLVNAVKSYLENNGYQVTNNAIATGCKALINAYNDENTATGYASSYGTNSNNTTRINNVLATIFPPNPPKDDIINDLAGITMLTKDELRAMASNGPISRVMASLMKGKISVNSDKKSKNIIKKAIKGINDTKNSVSNIKTNIDNFVSDSIHPGIKVSNIQIIGTDNVYIDNLDTNTKSKKLNNRKSNTSNNVRK